MKRFLQCPRCHWVYQTISLSCASDHLQNECGWQSEPVCGDNMETFHDISPDDAFRILPLGVSACYLLVSD